MINYFIIKKNKGVETIYVYPKNIIFSYSLN